MKILVTGASGFLGSHLVNELVKSKHQVTVFVRENSWHPLLDGLNIRKAQGDILDNRSLERAIKGQDTVIHAAGMVSFAPNMKQKLYEANVQGTRNVITAALKNHTRRLIHVSSIAAVGVRYDRQLMDEETQYNGQQLSLPYFDSKIAAEREAIKGAKFGMDVAIVNPATLIGPYDMRFHSADGIRRIAKTKPLFLLHGGNDFVDVRDAAAGIVKVMENGRRGERYILGGENLGFDEFIKRVCKVIGRKVPKRYMASWAMDFTAGLLKVLESMGYQGRVSSHALRRSSHLFMFHSLEKAKRDVGYRAQPIDQAIYDTILWMQTIGKLPGFKLNAPSANGHGASDNAPK